MSDELNNLGNNRRISPTGNCQWNVIETSNKMKAIYRTKRIVGQINHIIYSCFNIFDHQ